MERLKSQKLEPPPEVVGECCGVFKKNICFKGCLQVKIWNSKPPSVFQLKETRFQKFTPLITSRWWWRESSHGGITPSPKILTIHLRTPSNSKIKSWPSRGSPSHTRTSRRETRKPLKASITCHNPGARTETAIVRLEQHWSVQGSGPLLSIRHRRGGCEDEGAAQNQSIERQHGSVISAILGWQTTISVLKYAHLQSVHAWFFGYVRSFDNEI